MIDHVWTVVCSSAVIDVDSNNASLLNVLEQINVSRLPETESAVPIPFDVVSLWVRSDPSVPAQGMMRALFVFPSGRSAYLTAESPRIDLTEKERFRVKIHAMGLPIEEAGRHHFVVEFRHTDDETWVQVARVPLTINIQGG